MSAGRTLPWFRAALKGDGGAAGACLCAALAIPACLYGGVMMLRRGGYRRQWLASYRAPVPVISIGNLSAGGTGKTPCTIALATRLLARGERVGILLRGYGARDPGKSDEARLYRQALPEARVYADPDRVASAQRGAADGCTVLLLDDGFQHQRLARDLDLVLIDCTNPWSSGWPFPAGLLREWPRALADASAMILTRADQAAPESIHAITETIRRWNPGCPLLQSQHQPTGLIALDGSRQPLEFLQDRECVALAGIGRPGAFVQTLRHCGARVNAMHAFPDHWDYSTAECSAIALAAGDLPILTTAKDGVKLQEVAPPELQNRIWCLEIEMTLNPEEAVWRLIEPLLTRNEPPPAGDPSRAEPSRCGGSDRP